MLPSLPFEVGLLAVTEELQAVVVIKVDGINSPCA